MPVIKRYTNRKLYNTDAGCYVTLNQIGEMVRNGEEVHVVDYVTGADLTALTYSQILFDAEKRIGSLLPLSLLSVLIRGGEHAWEGIRSGLSTLIDPDQLVKKELRSRLDTLVKEDRLSSTEAQRFYDLLLSIKRDEVVSQETPISQQELEALLHQVEDLEKQIEDFQKIK
jgi:polyhydroxyalkanoate synthesis repressor PhaR